MTLEELQAELIKVQEDLKKVQDENKQLTETVEEKKKREQELMEHNQKLFLKVTSKKEDNKQETNDEIPFVIDKKTYELLNDREKEELNELINEEE